MGLEYPSPILFYLGSPMSMLIRIFAGFAAITLYAFLVVILDGIFDTFLPNSSGLQLLALQLIIPTIGLAILWRVVMGTGEERRTR